MPEGLSASEVGRDIVAHAKHGGASDQGQPDRLVSILEAVLLSIVTIVAAWSGYSAAKWNTESSLKLAEATATRTEANRGFQKALTLRVGDATMFYTWFTAYIADDENDMRVAEKRFRPEYRVAFEAWLATDPFTNPNAPPGPQQMPQYEPGRGARVARNHECRRPLTDRNGETVDNFVRTAVILRACSSSSASAPSSHCERCDTP